VAKLMVCSDLV
jgi:hypothetical protein